jgi:3-methylcrotonyl-CoA carboxylase alpha subunit
MVTGQDLVEWQLRVASGEPLPKRQNELAINGWAMEARLYAENPVTGFLPSIGPLDRLRFPDDIRIDSGVEEGGEVTPYYDPMIAKLIVHAPSRALAAAKLAAACGAIQVWPVRTNAAFLAQTAGDAAFVAGDLDTGFIERHADRLVPAVEPSDAVIEAAARALLPAESGDPWSALTGFRSNAAPDLRIEVEIADVAHVIAVDLRAPLPDICEIRGERVLFIAGEAWAFGQPVADHAAGGAGGADGTILSPMPGRILSVEVAVGDRVVKGQKLLVLEAMKMEQALFAPFEGFVADLIAIAGTQVAEGVALARIEKHAADQ